VALKTVRPSLSSKTKAPLKSITHLSAFIIAAPLQPPGSLSATSCELRYGA
jgi:hypothetical protein